MQASCFIPFLGVTHCSLGRGKDSLIGRPDFCSGPFSQSSVIVVVALAGEVVDNGVALDVDRGGTILHHHRWAVEVDAVVDHEQRVIVVDDIVVDTDAVKVLLE